MPSHRFLIDKFLHARKHYAWGPQIDYLDHWNRVGWVRLGDDHHRKAMAVLMSDGEEGAKWMEVGRTNTRFTDLTEHVKAAGGHQRRGLGRVPLQRRLGLGLGSGLKPLR